MWSSQTVSVIAIIPARGNSKRLANKNIRELDGRPLIAYSCLIAKACNTIDWVVVTSDSDEILEAAEPYADELLQLPNKYTTDAAPLTETLQYAIQQLTCEYDWVILLQPTSPLRLPSLLDRWIRQLDGKDVDGFVTVDRDKYKLGKLVGNIFQPDYLPMTPKAMIQEQFRENGVAYGFAWQNVIAGFPFTHRMLAIETPRDQSICNIDQQVDFDLTEYYYYHQGYQELFNSIENRYVSTNSK